MKRTLAALVVAPLALVTLASTATAARPEVTRYVENATYADAGSELSLAKGFVNVVKTRTGYELYLSFGTADGMGGSVDTSVMGATEGFTFTTSKVPLRSAQLTAEGLAAETCTWEYDEQIGCVDTTVDIQLAWTGTGKIAREHSTWHFKGDGTSVNAHGSSTFRDAEITGFVSGEGWTVDSFDWASLGTYRSLEIDRCWGDACLEPEPEE